MNQERNTTNIHSDSKKNKRLSVQISLTGQSFLISCIPTGKIEWKARERWLYALSGPEELLERTIRIVEDSNIEVHQIKEVKLYYHNSLYTLVPKQVWEEKNAALYLHYTLRTFPNDFIAYEPILHGKTKLVYIPYVNLNNYFFEKFGSFHYYHALGPWIDYCSKIIENQTGVFANFTNKQLDLLVFKEGRLHLANSFEYHTPEDVVYYTLFVYEQLYLNPEKVPLHLSGNISKSSTVYSALYTYIRYVQFISTEALKIKQLDEEEPHKDLLLKLGL